MPRLTIVTGMLVILPQCALAQQGEPPTARQILDTYVEALGGEMVLQSLESVKFEGTIDRSGTPGTFTFLQGQSKSVITVNISGRPIMRAGFDGEYVWRHRGGEGLSVPAERFSGLGVEMPGTPMAALEWLELKEEATLLDPDTIDQRATHVVRIKMTDGQLVTAFFDQESGLLIQVYIDATRYTLEYSDELVDGLRFVNKARTNFGDLHRFEWVVDEFVVNPELDGDEFRMPDGLDDW